MIELGHFATCLAWILSVAVIIGGVITGRSNFSPTQFRWIETLRRMTACVCVCIGVGLFGLGYAFVTNDYSVQYVWQYSNESMPWIYKISAIWGGMDGSMLLWCFFVSFFGALVAHFAARYPRSLVPWVLAFINSSTAFFLTITVFVTNPFRFLKAPFIPPDGNGLNPLLQNEYMAIHPPTLYLGFTAFAVPYALCMAGLCSGQLTNEWIRLTRRWCLIGWTFLTAGIVLGGHWAYIELGWGGFWAWDPVENASFLPWLTGTALLHSIMVQERKGMLKTWNVSLAVLTYVLTVFGTFLTRSGVVQSVHAFASTDVGWVFLLYLSVLIVLAVTLIFVRRVELRPEKRIESLFSREAGFLVNNLLLLSICFAVLWGVMFPVFSEWLTGVKQTVGIPFFNAVTVPMFLALVLVMGVGPLIAWRQSSSSQMARIFLVPMVSAFVIAIALVWAGIQGFYPILSYSLCFFVLMTILGELGRGMKAQRITMEEAGYAKGFTKLLQRHRIRYAGYFVHLGVVVMTVAITASMAHKMEHEFMLAPGEVKQVGRFGLQLVEFHEVRTANYEGVQAQIRVTTIKDGGEHAVLYPELRFYPRNKETTTEVALKIGPREDVYIVVAGLDDSGTKAAIKIFINPLQMWLWVGAIMMCIGGVIVAIPHRSGARVKVRRGVATTELSSAR